MLKNLNDPADENDQHEQPGNISRDVGRQFPDNMERIEGQHQGERQQFQREFQKPHICFPSFPVF